MSSVFHLIGQYSRIESKLTTKVVIYFLQYPFSFIVNTSINKHKSLFIISKLFSFTQKYRKPYLFYFNKLEETFSGKIFFSLTNLNELPQTYNIPSHPHFLPNNSLEKCIILEQIASPNVPINNFNLS